MSLGLAPCQSELFATTASLCDGRVAPDSIYGLLHRECHRLFADEMFADLFCDVGRRCVPPMIVAVVMVLQRIEGCSDREAVERFTFDARWKYAAGGLEFDYPGFVHTVLVEMRARLAASERPDRIFEVVLETAKAAGLVGRKRVLDSTPLYDAVATMDTVTLVRSAVRGLLAACPGELEGELRGLLRRDDDYRSAGKPVCDYDDKAAREAMIDALAKDARALLGALDGRELSVAAVEAARLLATVVGQDLDLGEDGIFRIARRVAKDRVISTVDPDARHGHKTSARGFDGYKGHVAVDPDSEIITATTVTAGNVGDAAAAARLLAQDLPEPATEPEPTAAEPEAEAEAAEAEAAEPEPGAEAEAGGALLAVYGDSAYGAGALLDTLERGGADIMCKVQPPVAPSGRYSKDAFKIDLDAATVTCPAGHLAAMRPVADGHTARFGQACTGCPLAQRCTAAKTGRTIYVGPYEAQLARARARQTDPAWKTDYTQTRPKVERKISHLMRRRHGARRARMRGQPKVDADFSLLAAAANLARFAALGLTGQSETRAAATA
jgi:hypothetical protein